MGFEIDFTGISLDSAPIAQALAEIVAAGVAIMDPMIDQAREEPHQNKDFAEFPILDGLEAEWTITPPRPHRIRRRNFLASLASYQQQSRQSRLRNAARAATGQPMIPLPRFRPPHLKFFWSKVGPYGQSYPWAPDKTVFPVSVWWHPDYAPRRAIYAKIPPETKILLAPIAERIAGAMLVDIVVDG